MSNLHIKPITLVFTTILLFSFGILIQNAFADGVQPGSCSNEYDGPITNATIIAENKAYYPLNNSVSFQLPYYKSYYLTFTVKTPGINDQGNSLPGNVWIDQDYQGFANSGCYGTAYPNQNFTVNETISHATSTSVFWATEVSGFSYTVNWLYPPSAPQNLQASAGNSQVTLSWSAPSSNVGSPITSYKIYKSTSSGTETLFATMGNVTSYNDGTVTNGQKYFYKVTAVNSVGESSQSNEASATPVTSNTTAKTISVGNQTLGGMDVNSNTNKIYVANFGNCSTMWSCSGSTGTTVSVIDGSTDSVTNTITVGNLPLGVGINPVTNKIYVSNVGSSTVSVIDGSTNNVTNTIKVGSAPIRVAVNPSTNKIYVANYLDQTISVIDGSTNAVTSTFVVGSRPTGIDINDNTNTLYVTNNANTLLVIDGSTNSVITTISLKQNPWDVKVNPVTNMVYVRAIGDDCSSQCVPVGVLYGINGATNMLVDTVPNLDPQLSGLVVNPVDINPVTNNIYATEYDNNTVSVIDGKTNGVVNTMPVGNHPNAVAVNLSTSKIYVANDNSVTVIQENSSTSSPPFSPQNLQSKASNSQVTLSWTTPSSNGGSTITGYNIYRGTTSGGESSTPVATGITSTTYSDTTTTNGQTYFYKVTAVNSVGESTPSNEASATPTAPTTVSSAPTGLTASTISSSQINLSWSAPANNGGSAITGYMIERSNNTGSTWSVVQSNTGSTATTYSDTGLVPSTTYPYRVSAINSVGTSQPSNVSSATTSAVTPPPPTGIVLNNIQSISGTVSSSNQMTLANFNTGTGNNKLLVVGISADSSDVNSITFNGMSLVRKAGSFYNNDAEFWYLKNPRGTGDIVVTMNSPTSAVVGAYSFTGVNQTSPLPTSTSKHNTTPNSPNITLTTKFANDWVLDLPSIYGGSTLGSPTCTQQWDDNVLGSITGASSSKIVPTPGAVTCKWTASSGDLWDEAAVEIKASK